MSDRLLALSRSIRFVALWRISRVNFRQPFRNQELQEQHQLHFNKSVVLAALKACSSLKDLQTGRLLHDQASQTGASGDIFVANTLISMYAKCGSMPDAQRVFDGIGEHSRDVVSWNALTLGYAENDQESAALDCLEEMEKSQHQAAPNARTFLAAIKACSRLAAKEHPTRIEDSNRNSNKQLFFLKQTSLQKAIELHSQAVLDIFVANSLVDLYSKCGSMLHARAVFELMPCRTAVSWTSLILGYTENGQPHLGLEIFDRMQDDGCTPDALSYVAALKACTCMATREEGQRVDGRMVKVASLDRGVAIHSQAMEAGWVCSDLLVASTLLDMYAKCGSLDNALAVFNRMPVRDSVPFTALMLGYGESGEGELALALFQRMQIEGCVPDSFAFVAALNGCISLAAREFGTEIHGRLVKTRALEQGMKIHTQAAKLGCDSNMFVSNTLIDMYVKCGSMIDARKVFDKMLHRDVVSWNSLMMGYIEAGEAKLAFELFETMESSGCMLDSVSFVTSVKACTSLAAQEQGRNINDKVVKLAALEKAMDLTSRAATRGCDGDLFVASSLVELYANCGSMADARRVFDKVPQHDVVLWSALILGYAENGEEELALDLFACMRQLSGCVPDAQTFAAALKACGSLVALESCKAVHAEIQRRGLELDPMLMTSLVDVYGKCGSMVNAQHVFDSCSAVPDSTAWTVLLAGYGRQGDTNVVLELFDIMQGQGLQADSITFVCLLNACSHAGLVDTGRRIFEAMSTKYRVKPIIDHYICMVDMYGRANQLDKAIEMIQTMPFKANVVIWRTLLAACMKWKNVAVGKLAFESLVILDEKNTAGYSLMANIYRSGRETSGLEVNKQWTGKPRSKSLSCSCTEADDRDRRPPYAAILDG